MLRACLSVTASLTALLGHAVSGPGSDCAIHRGCVIVNIDDRISVREDEDEEGKGK